MKWNDEMSLDRFCVCLVYERPGGGLGVTSPEGVCDASGVAWAKARHRQERVRP
jgi:hypothetical protein